MSDLHERYLSDQIHVTGPQLREHGNCPAVELSALNFFLSGKEIPWTTIQLDDESARAVQIGELPSYLVLTEGKTMIALPQQDGSINIRPFESATMYSKYMTLRQIAINPYMNPTYKLQMFIQALESNFRAHSIIPSQQTLEELFSDRIRE